MKRLASIFVLLVLASPSLAQEPLNKVWEWPDQSVWIGVTSLNGKVYGAWLPPGHSEPHFIYSNDGVHFLDGKPAGAEGFGGSSIAAYNGRLYIAWAGGNAAHSLCVAPVVLDAAGIPQSVDLTKKVQSVQSSGGFPWLVSTDKGLYIAWLGTGNGHPNLARVNVP